MLQSIKQRILCGLVLYEQHLSFVILTHLKLFFPITCQRKNLSTVLLYHSQVSRLIKKIPWEGCGQSDWRIGIFYLLLALTAPLPIRIISSLFVVFFSNSLWLLKWQPYFPSQRFLLVITQRLTLGGKRCVTKDSSPKHVNCHILHTIIPKSTFIIRLVIFARQLSVMAVFFFLSGKSLTIVNGKRWQQMRKLLTPAFHADILRPYVKLFQESTKTLLVSNSLEGNFLFDVGN